MRISAIFCLFIGLLGSMDLLAGSAPGDTKTASAAPKPVVTDSRESIPNNMQDFMKKYAIPGAAMAVTYQGQTKTYVFGLANQQKHIPVTKQTLFEVGSLTKLFTTLLIAEDASRMVRYQAGADVPTPIRLDTSITRYVPLLAQNPAFKPVTLINLATFSAGLPFALPSQITSVDELSSYLLKWKPAKPVGSEWIYSNMSIGLLRDALQSQYNKPLDAIYGQEIFTPLRMSTTGTQLSAAMQSRLAQGYSKDGQLVSQTTLGLFPSAYALKSNITDLSHFLMAAAGAPKSNHEIEMAMQVAQTPRAAVNGGWQGMGWQMIDVRDKDLLHAPEEMNLGPLAINWLSADKQQFNPHLLIDKTGATDGFRAYIAVIPEKQAGIVIVTNRYVSNGAIVNFGRKLLMQTIKKGK